MLIISGGDGDKFMDLNIADNSFTGELNKHS